MSAIPAMSLKPRPYNLSEVIRIKDEGFNLNIPQNILEMINLIANQVGAPTYIRTPQFHKKQGFQKKRRRKAPEIDDEDWEAMRNFQATERIEKEGLEKLLSTLRGALNKITDKNYDGQKDIVMDTLDEINKNEAFTDEENLNVSKTIFEIASTNKFYSSVYAQLFKDITARFETMNSVFRSKFESFLTLFEEIEASDPNEDYNKFCIINKNNANRRALSMFFVNLMKHEIVSKEAIINIIQNLQKKMMAMITEEDNKSQVDEISETLFIFITNAHEDLEDCDTWNEIKSSVEVVSKMSVKSQLSITNKSIFKHLDILDEIN
tara:strand:+ start:657 stop:1622 length:966 start_codon:yes stop_codon:yes gene_type:complete